MGKHIYGNNKDSSITMAAICSGTQTITTGIPTNTELLDTLGGRLPPTFSFAAADVLLLATSTATTPDCYREYPLEYVVEAMTAASATTKDASNKKSLSTAAGASDRNCNKRNNNNSSRNKYNNNNVNISDSSSSCYTHGSKSQHNSSNNNSGKIDCPIAATATITTTVKTTSCNAGESGKMLMQQQQPAQLVTTTPTTTTITPACKISHRKNKRSSNNQHSSNASAAAAAATTTAASRRTAASTTTAKISKTKVAARSTPASTTKLKLSPTAAAALPMTMLLQFMQLLKNATTRPTTTTTTDKSLSAAARSQAAAVASTTATTRTRFRLLPGLGATSFFTLLTLVCLETVLLSTVSNCAKTFYMHWNTSNSIFRIDNTDHIIDVNKGNLAFEFDQVHIICPVYEPGTFENETEKYIIYNVSKVEYETCRITNADPRVIAICDKPQKLMFFTITFRPFTPQPGGLEFLPGNDYYFISTSSKDDLYRRIGGRCSTNNMKVVFKVCCAPEEKNKTTSSVGSGGGAGTVSGAGSPTGSSSANNAASAADNGVGGGTAGLDLGNVDLLNTPTHISQHPHMNNINTIGINSVNTGLMPIGGGVGVNGGSVGGGIQLKSLNGVGGTSINTNVDQFNRIPMQTNGVSVMGNNIGGMGLGSHGGNGIMLTPGGVGGSQHGGINLIPSGGIGQYPGQTGIRINNVASQQHHPTHKINNNNNHNDDHFDKHPNEVVKNEELTYNSGAASVLPSWRLFSAHSWLTTSWLLGRADVLNIASSPVLVDVVCGTWLSGLYPASWYKVSARCSASSSSTWSSRSSSSTCGSGSSVWTEQQLQQHSNFRIYRQEITLSKSIVNFKYLIFSYYKVIVVSIALIIIVMKCIRKSILSAAPATYTATATATASTMQAESMSKAVAVSQATATATQLLSLSSSLTSPTNAALSLTTQTGRQENQSLDLVESEESSYLPVNYYHNSKTATNYSESVKSFR